MAMPNDNHSATFLRGTQWPIRYCFDRSLVVTTPVVMCIVAALAVNAPGADYTVHVVAPAVTNHMILPDGPLPPVCKEAEQMALFACRGEYESASFVVSASKPLEAVRVELGQLDGAGGRWPKQAVDVRVVAEIRRSVLNTNFTGLATIPTLLVHDGSFLAIEPATKEENSTEMKDVLRGEMRDTAELQPVTIERRKQFWVTVHVPENAKPGDYRTTARIVPQNSEPFEFTLHVTVYPFDLLPPMLEYSMFYPTQLISPGQERRGFHQISARQYRLEIQNMVAHGLSNPNIYYTSLKNQEDASLDFSVLEQILKLRESAGMRPRALYLVDDPVEMTDRPLTPQERQRTHRHVREIDSWAGERGYEEVVFMVADEWLGDQLSGQRDSMIAVDEAGGRVFAAVMEPAFFDRVGDVLHRPVLLSTVTKWAEARAAKYSPQDSLRHMHEIGRAGSFERIRGDESFRKAIDGVHRAGHKIFTYMNPPGGYPLPDMQRRLQGLGLWRVGFDGTMTWAYIDHHTSMIDMLDQNAQWAQVFRTADGVLDTLHWEGFREGVDDVRYLTTLYAALRSVAGRFPQDQLIAQTYAWLAEMDVADGDLDDLRREMARRTVALMDLGFKQLTPEQALAGIDLEDVRVIAFPEPWRFKMDPKNIGVTEKWFDPALDDEKWGLMRTNTGWGWGRNRPGIGWYRTELPLTEQGIQKKFKYLHFRACDEEAWVYLNGRQLLDHSCEVMLLTLEQIWVKPFIVELSGMKVSASDLLTVRVRNAVGMGGIHRPVHLIVSDQELTKQHIDALLKLKTAKN